MKLPVPALLYTSAAALVAWAGYTVYDSAHLWRSETAREATIHGRDVAIECVARGRSAIGTSKGWNYTADAWWRQFLAVNLIAKVEKRVDPPGPGGPKGPPIPVPPTPLEDIFEIVVCYHNDTGAEAGNQSHVVIRYKPDSKVEPPQWWLDENTALARVANAPRRPVGQKVRTITGFESKLARAQAARDAVRARDLKTNTSQSPSIAGLKVVQKLYVDADDPRREAKLWPPYYNIKLVRVDVSGESAWFLRDGNEEPEELLKTTAEIPQDVLRAVRKLQNREVDTSRTTVAKAKTNWLDVDTTTKVGNTWHIGRNDEQMFREPKDLFGAVHFDTFVSKYSNTRGLIIRNVDKQLAKTFGLQGGEVLLKINGRSIRSKAQGANMVKRSYERGVRTFTTTWWSNGQEIERVYQAPDR